MADMSRVVALQALIQDIHVLSGIPQVLAVADLNPGPFLNPEVAGHRIFVTRAETQEPVAKQPRIWKEFLVHMSQGKTSW